MGQFQSTWPLKLGRHIVGRFRPRFRLRSFFIAFTLFTVVFGCYASRAQQQRRAVAAIERLGGTVIYDYQYYIDEHDERCIGLFEEPPDKWYVHLLGRDYFHRVAGVYGYKEHHYESIGSGMHSFGPSRMRTNFNEHTDECLKSLGGIHSLVFLNLRKTTVTDAGLNHLLKLHSLERLNLYDCNITDEGLRTLPRVKGLSEISLLNTKVTAEGIRQLQTVMPRLEIWHPVTAEVVDGAWVQRKRAILYRHE